MSLCLSVYDLDDDGVGRRRPSAGSIIQADYITIVSEDEQCTERGNLQHRVPEFRSCVKVEVAVLDIPS